MNLAENLSLSATKTPEAPPVRLDDEVLSYRALDDASARVAGLLASRGVGPGDRVGIMLPNVRLFPVIDYGILRLGATVVPMNVLLKGRETAHYLKDPGAKAVFAWQAFAEHAQTGAAQAGAECIQVEPEGIARLLQDGEPHSAVTPRDGSETAVILYTSGTTGVPKGAELSHGNLAHNCRAAAGLFGIGAATVTLGALPLFHSFGQTCAMNATIWAGGCLTLIARFEPAKALEVIERVRVSVFEGVPTTYGALLNDAGADAACIDTDGWFRTGDPARAGEDGYFFIVDRKKDMIIRGGYNVYPREIEEVLYEHPAVREAAVVALPDDEPGEKVGAAVALKAGAQATAQELSEFVKEPVAAYKYPREVWFVDELPKGPTGKILKRAITLPAQLAKR